MGLIRESFLKKVKKGIIESHPDMTSEEIDKAFKHAVRKVEQEIEDNLKKNLNNHIFFSEKGEKEKDE